MADPQTPVQVVTFPPRIEHEFAPGEVLTLHVDISGLPGPVILHCEVLNAADAEIDGSVHQNWQTTANSRENQEADFVIKMPPGYRIVPTILLTDESGLISYEVPIDVSLHPTPAPARRTTIGGRPKKQPPKIQQVRPKQAPSDLPPEETGDASSDNEKVVGVGRAPGAIIGMLGGVVDPGNATSQFLSAEEVRRQALLAEQQRNEADLPTDSYEALPTQVPAPSPRSATPVPDPGEVEVDVPRRPLFAWAMVVGMISSAGAVVMLGISILSFAIWLRRLVPPTPVEPPSPEIAQEDPAPVEEAPTAPTDESLASDPDEAIPNVPFVGPPLPPPPPVKCDWYHDPRYGALTVTDGAGHYLLQCGDKIFAAMHTVCKPKKGCTNEDLVELDANTLKPIDN